MGSILTHFFIQSKRPHCIYLSPALLFRSSENERHFEHMDKVRHYHQSLQEQAAAPSVCGSSADLNPSSSLLFSTLRYRSSDEQAIQMQGIVCFFFFKTPHCFYRKKLSELDNIQRYFSHKISTATFPSMSEQDGHGKLEEQRETDTCQLLLKSNHLVGQVNNIICGELFYMLKGVHLMVLR